MLHDTLSKIESHIQGASAIEDKSRAELLALVETLKTEIGELSKTHQEEARSITGFAELSAYEATRRRRNPQLVSLSAKGLAASAKGFEHSHPRLVESVNRVCSALANMGI
jgi:hypothetical protein